MSCVNSVYENFGSGIVVPDCGFTLQNRGANFTLEKGKPNSLAPRKRPYHTIIPSMMLDKPSESTGRKLPLYCTLTNMGGFMQPQGHVQLYSAMIDFNKTPQEAINAPRFCILCGEANGEVIFEEGISPEIILELKQMGHRVREEPIGRGEMGVFGKAQIITVSERDYESNATGKAGSNPRRVLCGGSDCRGDGCALGY